MNIARDVWAALSSSGTEDQHNATPTSTAYPQTASNINSDYSGHNKYQSRQTEEYAVDTIQKLCERIRIEGSSIEDRRDSIRALRALAKEYQVQVGAQSMDVLVQVLKKDSNELTIIHYTLETFCFIFATLHQGLEGTLDTTIGLGFSEIFVKNKDYVEVLIDLLANPDFQVRYLVLEIFMKLVINKCDTLQESLLSIPQGASRLMDVLEDQREPLRNNTLLLLIRLTRGNALLQQIVVFENAYSRLLDIVQQYGGLESEHVLVQDSFSLIHNLSKSNISNQNHFREMSTLRRCNQYLEALCSEPVRMPVPSKLSNNVDETNSDSNNAKATATATATATESTTAVVGETGEPQPDDKKEQPRRPISLSKTCSDNYVKLLSILRILVTPSNPNVYTNQTAFLKQNTFLIILNMAFGPNFVAYPPKIKTLLRYIVAECARKNITCQNLLYTFNSNQGQSSETKPGDVSVAGPCTLILMDDILNTFSPFEHRTASLYAFASFLNGNRQGQFYLFRDSLLLAKGSAGKQSILIDALFNVGDIKSMWLSSLSLCYMIQGNPQVKGLLLDATDILQCAIALLDETGHHKYRIWTMALMMLAYMCTECSVASNLLLSDSRYEKAKNFILRLSQEQQNSEIGFSAPFLPGLATFVIGLCMLYSVGDSIDLSDSETVSRLTHSPVNQSIMKALIEKTAGGQSQNGAERFKQALKTLLLCDQFTNAAENYEIPTAGNMVTNSIWFDYEFTVLVKKHKDSILRFVTKDMYHAYSASNDSNVSAQGNVNGDNQATRTALSQQYKQLIRTQNAEIAKLKQQIENILENPSQQSHLDDMKVQIERLRMAANEFSMEHNVVRDNLVNELQNATSQYQELKSEQEDLLLLLEEQDESNNVLQQRVDQLTAVN